MEFNSNLAEQIKRAKIVAMKEKDEVAKSLYEIILSKIMLDNIKKRDKGEQTCDADVVAILQKSIKEMTETMENYQKVNNTSEVQVLKSQIDILNGYLPKMMTQDEIRTEILSLSDRSVGNVMKHFKLNFAGKCDMRDVSNCLKSMQ